MVRDALVVGINTYKHIKSLQAPAHDAEAIAHLLLEYGEFQVTRLPETVDQGQLRVGKKTSVSQDHLEEALIRLFNPDGSSIPDTALFYFSGHGMRVSKGGVSEGFLVTSDGDKRCWGTSFKWLQELLAKSPVQQKVVILDCCHSGEFITSLNLLSSSSWQGRDRCFIAASREFEASWEDLDSPLSTVTKILVDGLDPRRHQKPVFTSIDLIQYLYDYLDGATQRPIHQTHGSITLTRATVRDDDLTKAEHLAKCLWTLDYTASSKHHRQLIEEYYPACGFLISAQSDFTQRWIVKRFARDIPDSLSATFISFRPGLIQFYSDSFIDSLHEQITGKLGIELEPEDDIIKRICEKASCKPVIIALYINKYSSEIDTCIKNFLIPLMKEAKRHIKEPASGVFIYLLGSFRQSNAFQELNCICLGEDLINALKNKSIDPQWTGLARLDDLHEIGFNDVADWLNHADNFNHACTYIGKEKVKEMIIAMSKEGSTSTDDPEAMIRSICQAFSLTFADIEQYWKLEKAG